MYKQPLYTEETTLLIGALHYPTNANPTSWKVDSPTYLLHNTLVQLLCRNLVQKLLERYFESPGAGAFVAGLADPGCG